jgi:hypothetical protein
MHRRPDLYGVDAELVRPERWDEDMSLRHSLASAKWGYLPSEKTEGAFGKRVVCRGCGNEWG